MGPQGKEVAECQWFPSRVSLFHKILVLEGNSNNEVQPPHFTDEETETHRIVTCLRLPSQLVAEIVIKSGQSLAFLVPCKIKDLEWGAQRGESYSQFSELSDYMS